MCEEEDYFEAIEPLLRSFKPEAGDVVSIDPGVVHALGPEVVVLPDDGLRLVTVRPQQVGATPVGEDQGIPGDVAHLAADRPPHHVRGLRDCERLRADKGGKGWRSNDGR